MKSFDHSRCIAIVLMLLLASLSVFGQTKQASSTDESSEVPKTGAITGRVVNESGQPLPNAAVLIRAFGVTGPGRTATTDSEGAFQVTGLDPVAYTMWASVPAYTQPPRDPDNTQASYYRVGDSVTLVLIKGGVITGTVTTPAGEPVVGARIRVQTIRDANGQPPRYGAAFREHPTDDRGIYRMYGLPTGTYLVSAGGGGNFRGSDVDAYGTDAPTYSPSSTRDTAAEINVRAGEETANVDIRYRGEPGRVISGVASGPQVGPSGFNVTLTSSLEEGSQPSSWTFQPPGSRGFVFYGVADGDYDVTAQSFFPGGELTVSEPKRIKVRGADITGIEVATKPLGSISGRVVLEGSKAGECKGKRRPLFAETVVSAWHNEGTAKDQPQFIWSIGGPSIPDKQGDISLRNLAPGQYRFVARFFAKYWYLQSISLQPSVIPAAKSAQTNLSADAARNWTTLKSGDRLSGLTITLAEGAASLRGQVTMAEGQKLPGRLFVYLIPAEREKSEDVLRFFAAPVDADGKIVLNNVAPGRYWIVAQPTKDGDPSPLTKLRLPDETETRAKLRRDAEDAKNAIEFKPCQNVTDYQLTLTSASTMAFTSK
jgi:hypothetical protein